MKILLIFFIFVHCFINALTWTRYTILPKVENASTPQISFNDDNEGFVIYGYNSKIYVSKYDETFGTGSAISGALTSTTVPQISRNTSDEAAAVWITDGQYTYQSSFNASTWSIPTYISQHTDYNAYAINGADVSMNDDGDAIAVWGLSATDAMFGKMAIQVSQFTSSSWSPYSDIVSGMFDVFKNPKVKYNDSGHAMATFWNAVVLASYYNGTSWSTQTISDGGEIDDTGNIAMDNSNRAVAVWAAYDDPTYYIKARTYNGTIWSSVETLFSSTSHVGINPQVSMNNSGNALVIFSCDSDEKIRGCKYLSGTWSHTGANAYTLSASGVEYEDENVCSVSISSTNEGVAVWKRPGLVANTIEASIFNWGTDSWDSTEDVQVISNTLYNAQNPRVEINSSDNSVAVFEQYDGTKYDIAGAVSSDPPPI